jgi:hypothetical protein
MKGLHWIRTLCIGALTAFSVSCGQQPTLPQIDGVKGPFFNVADGRVLISMTLEKVQIIGGGRIPLDQLQNSYLEVAPAQFGGTLLQVGLDLTSLEGTDWTLVPANALPGGRPLPGVIGGKLPSFAVHVPEFADSTFYVSKQVFGFFLPMDIGTNIVLTFPLYMNDKHLGNISVVGADADGKNGGVLLLINLNREGKAQLKRLLEHSKKAENRGKVY